MNKLEIAVALLIKNYRSFSAAIDVAAPLSEERALALANVEAYENSLSIFDIMLGGTGRGIADRIDAATGTDESIAVDFVMGRT